MLIPDDVFEKPISYASVVREHPNILHKQKQTTTTLIRAQKVKFRTVNYLLALHTWGPLLPLYLLPALTLIRL